MMKNPELPLEKQERIIKAIYMVFAHNNYKNASMSRIADVGGISKSLLFHYFHNKKELYLYLWENINKIRALFAENPEIREATGKSYDKTYEDARPRRTGKGFFEKGREWMAGIADTLVKDSPAATCTNFL